jgi:apolipoprotein N-acyltransferase
MIAYEAHMDRFPKCLALLLGLLSATGFAPLSLWPVTLICFAGLLWLVERAQDQRAALVRGYWFGVGHFIVGLNWIAGSFRYQEAMPVWLGWVAVVVLAFYLAVYPALAAGAAWRWGREDKRALVIFFAAGWIVTEWLRATLFTGFAWNPLGVVALDFGHASRWIGSYGLSGLFILASGVLFLGNRGSTRQAIGLLIPLVLFGGFALQATMTDYVRGEQLALTGKPAPLLRIVQPNISQQDKHDEEAFATESIRRHAELSGKPGAEPRLILWPEAAIPQHIAEDDAEGLLTRDRLSPLLGPKDILLLGGEKIFKQSRRKADYLETEWVGAANSLFAMDAKGALLWRYDKAHLVPYGEYLALRWLLEPLGATRLVPGNLDFWAGPGARSFDVPGLAKVGVQICYEIIFSGEVVDRTNRPDFIFNPSNDAWFGAWGSPQFLAQSRLRAMEEGLPVIRATPTGISAIIDAQGRVVKSLPYQKAGFIEGRLPRAAPPTLFSRLGNVLPLAFAALLSLIAVALSRRNG